MSTPAVFIAAQEEYSSRVRSALLHVANLAGTGHQAHGPAPTYGDAKPFAGVRSARAYALRDAIDAAIPAIAEILPPGAVVTRAPLAYHDVAPQGSRRDRLGYEVEIEHPWLDDSIVILLDSPEEPEEDGDDDSDE